MYSTVSKSVAVPQVAIVAGPDAAGVQAKTASGPLSLMPHEPRCVLAPLVTPPNVPPCGDTNVGAPHAFGGGVAVAAGAGVVVAVAIGAGDAVTVAVAGGGVAVAGTGVTVGVSTGVDVAVGSGVAVTVALGDGATGGATVSTNAPSLSS
jgi:hypothetical protein